ncbi:MAG: glycosyltransferase family 39 protein [Solirubrobacteraceae bacterium]
MSVGAVAGTLRPPQMSVRSVVGAATLTTRAVIGLTVLAAVLRFARIGHQSFWYDESFTVLLVHHSPSAMLRLLPRTELTPPLYYLLAWAWARIFGYGEVGLRSLSALAGVGTVPAIYGVAAKLVSRRAGLAAAAIACCSPLMIWYSQEARSYALLMLLATLSLLAFAHARLPAPTPWRLGAWALAASATLATHYYGVLAVLPQALWLCWTHRRDRRVLLAVAAVGALGLALLPIALRQRPQASWIAPWRLDLRLAQIAPQYLLGTGAPGRTWLELAGAAALLLAATLLARRADGRERRGAIVAGALAASGLLLSLALVLAGVDELITRNVIVVLIPLIVLVSSGLGARRAGRLGLAGVAIICAVGLIASIGVAAEPNLQRPDWRALARAIGSDGATRVGRAILIQRYVFLKPLALDMPRLRFIRSRGELVNELDLVAIKAPADGWFCWWGSACNLLSSKLDTSIRVRGLYRDGPVLHVDQFSILRLRSAAGVRLTPPAVLRAVARAPLRAGQPQPRDLPPGFGPPYRYVLLAQPPA